MSSQALWMLIRPSRSDVSGSVLPVTAFAVVGAVAFCAASLARVFWLVPDGGFGQYKVLAVGMLAVLVIPAGTLGGSAARLSARRREDRLAALRLMGASPGWTRGVALAEASLLAAIGAALGALCYGLFAPALALIEVAGVASERQDIWLPPLLLVAIFAALVLVSAISAGAGLRQVMISPLGVRMRTSAPKVDWLRAVVAAAVIVAGFVVLQFTSASWGAVGITAAIVLVLVAVMSAMNLIGPFLVGQLARRRLARSQSAEALIAARGVLESPKAAWRQVSGVALASFVAVPAGSILGFLDMVRRVSPVVGPEELQFFADIRTVVIAAVAVSYLLVACSVGVTQAATVFERRALYVSLDRIGMPLSVMKRARRLVVSFPLMIAAVFPALVAAALLAPAVGVAVVTAPLFMVAVLACILLGVALVRCGVAVTDPLLRRVLSQPDRGL